MEDKRLSLDHDEVKEDLDGQASDISENVNDSNTAAFVRETKATIELNRRALSAEARVTELKRQLSESNRARDDAIARVVDLENHSEHLRGLVAESMRSGDLSKNDACRAEAFFKRLGPSLSDPSSSASEALLRNSEPPLEYASESQGMAMETYSHGAMFVKVDHTHATELESTKARLKQANFELDRLRNKLEEVCGKKSQAIKIRNEKLARAEQLIADKHTQILGAVRRVHYLLEQNERQQTDIGQKDKYIVKIEAKLLELSKELNDLRSQFAKPGAKRRAKAPNSDSSPPQSRKQDRLNSRPCRGNTDGPDHVNWQSVFEQGSLGRSPGPSFGTSKSGNGRGFGDSSPRPGVDHPISPRGSSKYSCEILDEKQRENSGKALSDSRAQTAHSENTKYSDCIDDDKDQASSPLRRQGGEKVPSRFQRQIDNEVLSGPGSPSSSVSSITSSVHDEWLSKIGASPI